MKRVLDFPIADLDGNIVFTTQNEAMAYYEILPVHYTYASYEAKEEARQMWMQLLRQLNCEIHLLSIPFWIDERQHEERMKQEVVGHHKHLANDYIDRLTREWMVQRGPSYSSRIYLGVRLGKPHQKGIVTIWKDWIEGAAGVKTATISRDDQEQERRMFQQMTSYLDARRVTERELAHLIRYPAYRGWKQTQAQAPKMRDLQQLLLGEYYVHPHHLCVRQVINGQVQERWVRFLALSHLPDQVPYPGGEWLYQLQHLPFPVDVSIRTKSISNRQAIGRIGKQKRRLGHYLDHTRIEGGQQDVDLERAYEEAAEEESRLIRERDPLLQTTVLFGIAATTKEELEKRSQQFSHHYQNQGIEIVTLPGDQMQAFHEFLPGLHQYIPDYTQTLKPRMLANAMIHGTQQLGDKTGMLIGFTGSEQAKQLRQPVFLDQARAAQGGSEVDTKSLGILLVGLTGYGKSHAAAQLIYQAMHHLGSKTILIDTKGERTNWLTDLPGCEGNVSLTRLGGDPKYRGMLDPFTLFSKDDAPLFAKDFLLQLVQVDRQHEWNILIQEAIQETKETFSPSMTQVLQRIQQKDPRLYRALSLYQSFPFAQLIFGNGAVNGQPLTIDKALNIIQIDQLRIPPSNKNPRDYDEIEILSKALMTPITGLINQLTKRDRHFNQIVWEEAWIPLASETGRQAINEGIRMGRYWNAATLLVSQNPSDVPRELVNNMGIRCVFKTKEEKEVSRALKILELEDTEDHRQTIRGLREGECLMRDVYGRVGKVYWDCLLDDLKRAFDTTPKGER
jgi:hypothetical protein